MLRSLKILMCQAEGSKDGRESDKAAHALAVHEESRLSYSHLETVLDSGKEFEADFKGAGRIDNLRSYM